jgi:hypothetical protein
MFTFISQILVLCLHSLLCGGAELGDAQVSRVRRGPRQVQGWHLKGLNLPPEKSIGHSSYSKEDDRICFFSLFLLYKDVLMALSTPSTPLQNIR